MLILGGTSEARALAELLVAERVPVVSSLAGRVSKPALPLGRVRIGGFGGAEGLAKYIDDQGVVAVVDATHPFATTISESAVRACAAAGVPLLRLARPGWGNRSDADAWQWVDSYPSAVVVAAGFRVMLTTGRTTLQHFSSLSEDYVLVRLVEPTADPLPRRWEVVLSRGPYTEARERRLMTSRRIEVLVTKDSGGSMTAAKLDVAAELGIEVVMVRRPRVELDDPVPEVSRARQAAEWVISTLMAR